MREVSIGAFARRLKQQMDKQDKFAFFLGAGCSQSSGIWLAAELVKSWLLHQHKIEDPTTDFDQWCKKNIDDYDENQPAKFYGPTIDLVFPTSALRQAEIDRQVLGHDPGFGYATLAMLLSHPTYGPCSNIVFTTNFDDLVADSLYLFTNRRPLVITHNALSGFVRQTSPKPVVIKLHGDAHLSPMNTSSETKKLHHDLESLFKKSVQERGLIFMGYGANDESITSALQSLPHDAIPFGIFWVNDQKPQGAFGDWLTRRQATWVNHRDFDQAMLVLGMELELDRPDRGRVNKIFDNYEKTEQQLIKTIPTGGKPSAKTPSNTDVKQAATQFAEQAGGPRSLLLKAYLLPEGPPRIEALRQAAEKYPNDADILYALAANLPGDEESADEVERLYKASIEANPKHVYALGGYAHFLQAARKDMDRAEQFYRRAADADLQNATVLGNYALFLQTVRKDMDQAEEYYHRALSADPRDSNNLGNYAVFLRNVRKDMGGADLYYCMAIEADPKNANALGNYALFLEREKKDMGQAERLYRWAIDAEPKNANALGNYAAFLFSVHKDVEKAESFFLKAIDASPNNANTLGNYAFFLQTARQDMDRAEEYYDGAIKADPKHANTLVNYATFLLTVRKDIDQAAQFYDRAIDAAPRHANALGNLAQLKLAQGHQTEGLELLDRAFATESEKSEALWLELWFYRLAHDSQTDRTAALHEIHRLLAAGQRSPGWDLAPNVARAQQEGHPLAALLAALAAVIADQAPLASLNSFPDWPKC